MKVSSINTFNRNYLNTKFAGLWGKTQVKMPDMDQALNVLKTQQIAYYYPFIDEKQSEINQVLDNNSSSQIIKKTDGSESILERSARQCAPIPVTKSGYEIYSKINSLSQKDFPMDRELEMRKAHAHSKEKYINSGFESSEVNSDYVSQTPAENDVVQQYYIKYPYTYKY